MGRFLHKNERRVSVNRFDQEATGIIRTQQPRRLATLESDLAVPVLQAVAIGVAAGLAIGVLTLALGGWLADLRGGQLWAWAGRLAGVTSAVGSSGVLVWFVLDTRAALHRIERVTGRDLDRDGHVGTPPTTRITIQDPDRKRTRFADLPLEDARLASVASEVLGNGASWSRRSLGSVLSQNEYEQLSSEMLRAGLLRELPGRRRELTGSGRALLRRLV